MTGLRLEKLRHPNLGPIDISVDPGECVCLRGASGSGKTLTLRAIADLDPHDGRVFLEDTEAGAIPAPQWRRQVGLLPAESQWWYDSVGEHLRAPDPEWLKRLGFEEDVLGWSISRLSTGEKQRLALIRLLENQPRALLLDEPTASLDPDNVRLVEAVIATYQKKHTTPILWVTHDPEQIERVAERGYRMDAGRIVEQVYP